MAELLQMINHEHPLVFNEDTSGPSDNTFHCAGCRKEVSSGPSYSCVGCGLYLHKECAEAPSEAHHPVHDYHPFLLLPLSDYPETEVPCSFCNGKQVGGFLYHCSCEFYLHINCALLPRDSTGNSSEILHYAHQHPLTSIVPKGDFNCHGCLTKLKDASYSCSRCRVFFHKKCLELPTEIKHSCHRKHPLTLVFNGPCYYGSACNLCQSRRWGYFFYRCAPCGFNIHPDCASPPSIIEDESNHQHPFTLLLRPDNPFICDACGNKGNHVSYICSPCNIQVHKDCVSLPRHIRLTLHPHPISHNFFLRIDHNDPRTWDCRFCYEKVNIEHGSYSCSRPGCDFVIHVKCSIENKEFYHVVEVGNADETEEFDQLCEPKSCIIRVIKKIKVGDDEIAGEIEHVSHEHNLIFSEEIKDDKYCNGCVLPLLSSFYYCSQCDFLLHKACAELPRMYRFWFYAKPLSLVTKGIFQCMSCVQESSGFSYKSGHGYSLCFHCALRPHGFTYLANEPHYLFFGSKHKGKCHACCFGIYTKFAYGCKDCTFTLHTRCISLPRTACHKYDEHFLTLTYQDPCDYPLRNYCDICEEERNPQQWFYHCKSCDNAIHINCVLKNNIFIKAGSKYTYKDHPHPLTFVKKIYYYPQCVLCGRPCQDLALECQKHACKYIVHWSCIAPSSLLRDVPNGE